MPQSLLQSHSQSQRQRRQRLPSSATASDYNAQTVRNMIAAILSVCIIMATTLVPSLADAQASLQGILGFLPFDNNLEESCKLSVYTSRTVLEAFRVCGGLFLIAGNTYPVSVLQTTTFLTSFCSNNCSSAIRDIQSIAGCTSGANMFYTSDQFNIVYNTSIPPNPAMDLLGSQPFPQVTSTMQAVQALLCPMTPDAKEYCVRKVIEKVAGGKDAAGINTITGVQVASDPTNACDPCFTGKGTTQGSFSTNITNIQPVATSFYTYMEPVIQAWNTTMMKSCPV